MSASERCVEIPVEIVRILDPGRKAQQIWRARRTGSLDRGPMLDEAFCSPKAGGCSLFLGFLCLVFFLEKHSCAPSPSKKKGGRGGLEGGKRLVAAGGHLVKETGRNSKRVFAGPRYKKTHEVEILSLLFVVCKAR